MGVKDKEKIKLDEKTAAVFTKKGYDVTDKISEGAFGQVYKAKKTDTGVLTAVKVMHINKIPKIVAEKFLPREFEASTTIRHKNVLEVFDIIRSNNCYYIFMEFAPNGSLMGHCKKGPIPEKKAKVWYRQCVEGLDCMHHEFKICHRDIKPDNILLDTRDVCKLSDFGFAKSMGSEDALTGTSCGTLPFYAPELTVSRGKYSPFPVDCWAMGVMLYMMLNSDYPFKFPRDSKDKEAMRGYNRKQVNREWHHRDELAGMLSAEVQDLVNKCLEPDPHRRYTTTKMLGHAWLRK